MHGRYVTSVPVLSGMGKLVACMTHRTMNIGKNGANTNDSHVN